MVTVVNIAKMVKTMINWRYNGTNGVIMQNANRVIEDDAYPLSPLDHDCRQWYGANSNNVANGDNDANGDDGANGDDSGNGDDGGNGDDSANDQY